MQFVTVLLGALSGTVAKEHLIGQITLSSLIFLVDVVGSGKDLSFLRDLKKGFLRWEDFGKLLVLNSKVDVVRENILTLVSAYSFGVCSFSR